MSTADSLAVVRRYYQLIDANALPRAVDELFDPAFRLHFDSSPEMDLQQAVELLGMFLSAFPGITHDIQDQFGDGERVVTRLVARGTHGGEFMGMPPTGREVAILAINIHRVVAGKIVEQWAVSDGVGMLRQLGAMPAS